MLTMLDLFSGIGGFSLAASWTGGIETVAFCEIEPFCQKVLKKHWPDVPIHDDIRTLRGEDVGTVDIVCGGFPCQPFSTAGKSYTKGRNDERYLWPEMFRVISEVRPTWVVGENVINFARLELDNALADMEDAGYETATFNISAYGIGAKHPRERIWIICNARSKPSNKTSKPALPLKPSGEAWRNNRTVHRQALSRVNWQESPSRVLRVADGIPSDVDRRRAIGNAIVPQVVYPIFQAIVEIEEGRA